MSRKTEEKIVIHLPEDRGKPHLPPEARERLGDGGAHKDKKRYNRKEKHKGKDD